MVCLFWNKSSSDWEPSSRARGRRWWGQHCLGAGFGGAGERVPYVTHIKVNIRVYNLLSPLMILSTRCYKEVQNVFFSQQARYACRMSLLGRNPKLSFLVRYIGFCFPELLVWIVHASQHTFFFFFLLLQSLKNNVLFNDKNNYVMHQDTLWADSGKL